MAGSSPAVGASPLTPLGGQTLENPLSGRKLQVEKLTCPADAEWREYAGMNPNERNATTMELTHLEGVIIPAHWDESGNVVSFLIATTDEQEYWLEDPADAFRLNTYLRKMVAVSGFLRIEENRKFMRIQQIQLRSPGARPA
jgi:hypothetical protein